jgi:hypothetical protein
MMRRFRRWFALAQGGAVSVGPRAGAPAGPRVANGTEAAKRGWSCWGRHPEHRRVPRPACVGIVAASGLQLLSNHVEYVELEP